DRHVGTKAGVALRRREDAGEGPLGRSFVLVVEDALVEDPLVESLFQVLEPGSVALAHELLNANAVGLDMPETKEGSAVQCHSRHVVPDTWQRDGPCMRRGYAQPNGRAMGELWAEPKLYFGCSSSPAPVDEPPPVGDGASGGEKVRLSNRFTVTSSGGG